MEIDLNESPLYPFELPSAMAFAHPALRFEECAAVNAALCEHAATGLCGRPFLADLLEWCEGGEVAIAVEAARERVRKGILTLDDCDSNTDATAGEVGDESDRAGERCVSDAMGAVRLNADGRTPEESTGDGAAGGDKSAQLARPSTTNRLTPEERAAAIESRRVAASEQSAAAKRRDALAVEEAAREAFERTEKAAARVAELEARAATDPRVAAESERLLRELRRREKGLSSTGRSGSDGTEGGASNGSSCLLYTSPSPRDS